LLNFVLIATNNNIMSMPEPSIKEQFIKFSEKHLPKYLVRYLKYSIIWNTLDKLLCVGEVLELKEKFKALSNYELLNALIDYCGLKYEGLNIERIPSKGRLLVVANHPLGGADWALIVQCIASIRKDIKVVINKDVNTLIVNMRDLFIPVDTYAKFNEDAKKKIGESLEREEAVLVFPSGGISIMTLRGVRDRKWKKGVLHFSRNHKTDILPIYIGGRFKLLYYLYPIRLRRFLLLHNLLHATPKNTRLVIGNRISWKEFQDEIDLSAAAARLKSAVYQIGRQEGRA
jgi:putative hemolysin